MAPWSTKSKNVGILDTAQRSTKNRILTSVTEAVSEVQYQYRNSEEAIPSNDITARLCTAIEAVFIQGNLSWSAVIEVWRRRIRDSSNARAIILDFCPGF